MLHPTQELEPPATPARFTGDSWVLPEVPLGESTEAYELEIRDTGGVLLRTVGGLGTTGFTYTAAMIADDLGGVAGLVTIRGFQIGLLGRGTAAEISVQL